MDMDSIAEISAGFHMTFNSYAGRRTAPFVIMIMSVYVTMPLLMQK